MKKMMKIIGITLLAIIIVFVIGLFVLSKLIAYQNAHYFENAAPAGDVEKEYTAMGNLEVSYFECDTDDDTTKKFEIWYPAEMENGSNTYPLVIMANGTGVKASAYTEVFKHLASWGFIVAGNEDEYSWSGASSAATLDYLMQMNEATVPSSFITVLILMNILSLSWMYRGQSDIYEQMQIHWDLTRRTLR